MKQSGSRFLAVLLRFRCVFCVRFQLGRSRSAEVRPLALALFVSLSLSLSLSISLYLSFLLALPLSTFVVWVTCPLAGVPAHTV
jgi:hypothetical protein